MKHISINAILHHQNAITIWMLEKKEMTYSAISFSFF